MQNCRILCRAFLGNLHQKYFPQFSIFFTFPPTFSKRHLPPPVNGVDAPAGVGLFYIFSDGRPPNVAKSGVTSLYSQPFRRACFFSPLIKIHRLSQRIPDIRHIAEQGGWPVVFGIFVQKTLLKYGSPSSAYNR